MRVPACFIFLSKHKQNPAINKHRRQQQQNYGTTNMAPLKEATKQQVERTRKVVDEKGDAESSPKKNQSESEIENDDRPLQIDTNNEVKTGTSESADKSEEPVNGKKRSTDSSDSNPTPTKKVRSKPKPQIIENMKEYIDNDTIEKLTTTTLLHWLKERNLHCSTRDKKAELVQKVKNHFLTLKT